MANRQDNERDGRANGPAAEQSTVGGGNDGGGGEILTQEQRAFRMAEAVAGVTAEFYAGHRELDVLQQRFALHCMRLAFCIELARAIEAEAVARGVRWDEDADWVEVIELAVSHWVDAKEAPEACDSAAAAFELCKDRAAGLAAWRAKEERRDAAKVAEFSALRVATLLPTPIGRACSAAPGCILEDLHLGACHFDLSLRSGPENATATLTRLAGQLDEAAAMLRTIAQELGPVEATAFLSELRAKGGAK